MSGKMHKQNLTAAVPLAFVLVLTGLAMSDAATADEFFRWVDDEGVVNFSQWAPPEDIDNVATLIVHSTNPPDYDPANDHYSIGNQAEGWKRRNANGKNGKNGSDSITNPIPTTHRLFTIARSTCRPSHRDIGHDRRT